MSRFFVYTASDIENMPLKNYIPPLYEVEAKDLEMAKKILEHKGVDISYLEFIQLKPLKSKKNEPTRIKDT